MSLLYEVPWWLPVALGLVGVVLGWTANNRQEKRLARAALALLILALITGAMSFFLESPRQHVMRLTRRLITAVEKRNWPAMAELLDSDITIISWHGPAEVSTGARKYAEQFGLERAWVSSINAEKVDAENIDVTLQVMADMRNSPSFPSNWKLSWQKEGDRWLVRAVDPLGSPALASYSLDSYFKVKP